MDGCLRLLLWWLAVGHAVWTSGCAALWGIGLLVAVIVWVSHGSSSVLWDIRYDLHAAWHHALRTAVTASVVRRSRTTKTIGQLLNECAADIVRSNVHGICDAKDNE